ncbi:MAG: ABC transporter substrate-binding protein [Candidatus Hydrogenedens sp.]|nr:ABC transporter substrate-binding protein [Candidatus Hydrogenedens sp.]
MKPALVLGSKAPEGLNAKVITAEPPARLDAIPAFIRTVGTELGAASAAEALANAITSDETALRKELAAKSHPRTLIVLDRTGQGVSALRCAGPGHLAADLAELAGTVNVLDEARGPEVDLTLEEVKALAPEVIIEFMPGRSLTENQRQALFNDWNAAAEVPARQSASIYFITQSHALRPGPRIVESARQLAMTIHGNFEFERELSARAE